MRGIQKRSKNFFPYDLKISCSQTNRGNHICTKISFKMREREREREKAESISTPGILKK
jgi:hypothetical protein